jgi:hypothetical protein
LKPSRNRFPKRSRNVPEIAPESVSEIVSENVPAIVSESAPENVSEIVSENAPAIVPEMESRKSQVQTGLFYLGFNCFDVVCLLRGGRFFNVRLLARPLAREPEPSTCSLARSLANKTLSL